MGWLTWLLPAHAAQLGEGDQAPAFELIDQNRKAQRLDDYRGRWVVLYFYPKDDTPGCTTEACAFRDGYLVLQSMGAQVLGISLDDTASHAAFAAKYHLPFPLLADGGGKVAKTYGVLWKLGPIEFAKRQTFLIDPEGRIARHYPSVQAERHAQQLVADLRSIQAVAAPIQPAD